MGRQISLFTEYRQQENSLTNYCGLLMKLLYEDSPRKFQELLTTLWNTDKTIIVGPTFNQQTKTGRSIPDLAIIQRSFSVFFETKLTDWFYDEQIEKHINGIDSGSHDKILFLLSNFETDRLEERFQKAITDAKKSGVFIQPLSFETLVGSLEEVCDTDYLTNLLDEFKIYLDRCGVLPKWKYLLDVANCSGTLHEIEENVYICPDTGGAYSHRRAKYFGAYADKTVSKIFEVMGVVTFDVNLSDATVKWANVEDDGTLIEQAEQKLRMFPSRIEANRTIPLQVFLLADGVVTRFTKETSGGMWQSKKYFSDIAKSCSNSQELANLLMDKSWSDFE